MTLAERSRSRSEAQEHDGPVGAADGRERFTVRDAEAVNRLRAVVRDGNVLRIWIKMRTGRP